jgi:hypothetical protein
MRKITCLEYFELVLGMLFLFYPRLILLFLTNIVAFHLHVIPAYLFFDRTKPYPKFFIDWIKITIRYISYYMVFRPGGLKVNHTNIQ